MKYLSVSPSEAQDEGGATKSQFYDFLPAELQGRRPNYLEIRSLYSVSNLDVCITQYSLVCSIQYYTILY